MVTRSVKTRGGWKRVRGFRIDRNRRLLPRSPCSYCIVDAVAIDIR